MKKDIEKDEHAKLPPTPLIARIPSLTTPFPCSSQTTTMAEVSALLQLPRSSSGLSFLGSSVLGSTSPRRKVARLESDSDISSRAKPTSSGPIRIAVRTVDHGEHLYEWNEKNLTVPQLRGQQMLLWPRSRRFNFRRFATL